MKLRWHLQDEDSKCLNYILCAWLASFKMLLCGRMATVSGQQMSLLAWICSTTLFLTVRIAAVSGLQNKWFNIYFTLSVTHVMPNQGKPYCIKCKHIREYSVSGLKRFVDAILADEDDVSSVNLLLWVLHHSALKAHVSNTSARNVATVAK